MPKYKIEPGSISSGTLRTEDLWSAVLWEAEHLRLSKDDRKKIQQLKRDFESTDEGDPGILDELWDLVNSYAPPYMSLRMHEGDGADLGWWIEWDSIEEDIRYGTVGKCEAGDPWPEWEKTPEFVLEVNDHGNATLKYASNGREVWSCV